MQHQHVVSANSVDNNHSAMANHVGSSGAEVTTGIAVANQAHSPTLSLPPQPASFGNQVAHVNLLDGQSHGQSSHRFLTFPVGQSASPSVSSVQSHSLIESLRVICGRKLKSY